MDEETSKYQSLAQLARELGISRATLYNRSATYEIDYSKLEFTQDELRLLSTRPDPHRGQKRTPKQKHDDELAELRRANNLMLKNLQQQHEEELEHVRDEYQQKFAKLSGDFERTERSLRKGYDQATANSQRTVKELQEEYRIATSDSRDSVRAAAALEIAQIKNQMERDKNDYEHAIRRQKEIIDQQQRELEWLSSVQKNRTKQKFRQERGIRRKIHK